MKKENLKILYQSFLSGTLIVLTIISLIIYTKGWFATNQHAAAENNATKVKQYDIETTLKAYNPVTSEAYECINNTWSIGGMAPGDACVLELTLKSNEKKEISSAISFLQPDNEYNGYDIPYTVDNKYFYLSTQLRVTDILLSSNAVGTSDGIGKYLTTVENGYDATGLPNFSFVSSPLTIKALPLATVILKPGETTIIKFTVTFVKSNVNQNGFKAFGSHGEESVSRRIICSYQEN